jgi:hypothetical protein
MNWISAKTLPPVGEDVLVFSEALGLIAVASLEESDDCLYWESDNDTLAASPLDTVTHWMPLPLPPS